MEIVEITFREWVVCEVRRRSTPAETPAEKPVEKPLEKPVGKPAAVSERAQRRVMGPVQYKVRRAGDRRLDEMGWSFAGKERRRIPERRIPEIEETSFAEFERWKKHPD